ncbi:YggT family protein [candidate division KSB1 bacterium]|nr:YggT family protein [candidate division KSB1 bacterium]
MFIIGNFLGAVAQILNFIITIYIWIIIIRVILSWVNPNPYHSAVQFIYRVTEPVLEYVRRFIPAIAGLDLSPVVVIFALYFLQHFLVRTLLQLASILH